jgi:hypothetical protein
MAFVFRWVIWNEFDIYYYWLFNNPFHFTSDCSKPLFLANTTQRQQLRLYDKLPIKYEMWDLKFSRRRVWCSELSSGIYWRVKWLSTDVSEVRTASIIHSSLMMEAVLTSETSVDNHFTRQYIPEDHSEHHTRRHENLKSHNTHVHK